MLLEHIRVSLMKKCMFINLCSFNKCTNHIAYLYNKIFPIL